MVDKFISKKSLMTYQTDRFGNIRPLMLMNELQAIADTHAEMLGFGRTMCLEKNIAWVVTHYLIDIIELPTEGEELTFTTWPSQHAALKAARDFEVRGIDGRLMIRATSQWILIDLETRRPLRLTEYLPNFESFPERAYNREFDKFPDFTSQKSHEFKCRFDDIDVNQHINNAVYAAWATESVGFDFRNSHKLRGLELNFKKEISPDISAITVDVAIGDSISHHKIHTDGTEHANVVCYWESNE
jgi:medium-chain acyl-[acyl-carrier-protein] hydrolase